MGHDIDLIEDGYKVRHTYITFNFSKYSDKYPGIHALHGHSNDTVIKILKKTLKLLLDDDIVPQVHMPSSRALTFGVPDDPQKDLECYAACLQEFLQLALIYKGRKVYWYSDQVWEITPFKENGYESAGVIKSEIDSDSDSD